MHTPTRRRLFALAVATLTVASSLAGATAANAATTVTYAADTFDRTTSSGLGTPDIGGAYTSTMPASARVGGGFGTLLTTPGRYAQHTLKTVTVANAVTRVSLTPETIPSAGNGVTTAVTLRSSNGRSYEAQVRIFSGGRVALHISRHDGSATKTTNLSKDAVVVRGLIAGQKIVAEFQATGTTTVSLRARVWVSGSATPAWQASADDGSAARVASGGSPALTTYLSAASPATAVRIDDYTVSTPSSTATPAPTPAPTPSTPNSPATTVGSTKVGGASYPVPASAIYVTAGAGGSGAGTKSSPYVSLQYAVDKAPSGSTLVLRGGTYHESVFIPSAKVLTIQNQPGEAVWLDGSSVVRGWTKVGTTWQVSGWTAEFDSRVSFTVGKDETSFWVDPAHPAAGYPDQLWVGGARLTQVLAASKVTAGTFYVDKAGNRLVIGSDPTGKTVEASTIAKGLKIHSIGTTVRGIGIKRYATSVAGFGAVSAERGGVTFENVVISDNATIGLVLWQKGHTLRNVTVTGNGLMGIGGDVTDNLTISRSVVSDNNLERFNPQPAAGGVKISDAENVRVESSVFSDNVGSSGLWFDESSHNVTVSHSTMSGNGRSGLVFELSSRATIVGNYVEGNAYAGIYILDANDADIWNNTLTGNARSLMFLQDARRQVDASLTARIPWVMSDVVLRNNVLSYGSGNCPILTQDLTERWAGNDFGVSFDANLYHRTSATSPGNIACWAAGSAGTQGFKTLAAFRGVSGGDARSVLIEGAPILNGSWQLTASAAAKAPAAYPMPAAIAAALGQSTGTTMIGAVRPPVVY